MTIKETTVNGLKFIANGIYMIVIHESWPIIKLATKPYYELASNYLYNLTTNDLETSAVSIAEIGMLLFPNGEIHKDLEGFIKLEQQGDILKAAQTEIQNCLIKTGIESNEATSVATCLVKMFVEQQSSMQDRITSFVQCYPMTPNQTLEIMGKVSSISSCLVNDIQAEL